MRVLLIILVVICQTSFSQKLVTINYTSYYDFDFPKKIPSQLLCNDSEAIFVEYTSKAEDWKDNKIEKKILGVPLSEFENAFNMPISSESFFYSANNKVQSIIFNDFFKGKKVWIKDDFNKINWKITKETKKIDTFTCYKATGTFRGNIWNVWFTYDIPISYGPWKLQGLPGVILEAATQNKQIQFVATKVVYNTTSKSLKPEIKEDIILFKDFITKRYEDISSGDFNRGTPVQIITFKDPIEPIYEWEEEAKK